MTARPQIGVGAVMLDGDRVCLVRRAQPPLEGHWSLPGGKLERGEALAAALRREVREETGLDIEVGELIEVVELIADAHHYVVLDYRCRVCGGELRAGDDAAEAVWARLDALADYQLSEAALRVIRSAARRTS